MGEKKGVKRKRIWAIEHEIATPSFGWLAMTKATLFCHCEKRSDEAVSFIYARGNVGIG